MCVHVCVLCRRILNSPPPFPTDCSPDCCNLLRGLLQKDPKQRLGAKGARQVKEHPWFARIDWKRVLERKVTPPFKPYMANEMDVGNFAQEFTSQAPIDSPGQLPSKKYKKLFRVSVCLWSTLSAWTHLGSGEVECVCSWKLVEAIVGWQLLEFTSP